MVLDESLILSALGSFFCKMLFRTVAEAFLVREMRGAVAKSKPREAGPSLSPAKAQ